MYSIHINAERWNALLDRLNSHTDPDIVELRNEMLAVHDYADVSEEYMEWRAKVLALADDLSYVDNDGEVEVDSDSLLSEGSDDGCYVSGWIWVPFDGTDLSEEE